MSSSDSMVFEDVRIGVRMKISALWISMLFLLRTGTSEIWPTRMVTAMAEAHRTIVAPHNAQGPVCTAASTQLGACIPNFYVQESFDEFNAN